MTETSNEERMLRADAWLKGRVAVGGIQARLAGEDVPYRHDSLVAVYPDDSCVVYAYTAEPPPADAVTLLRQVYPHITRRRVPADRLDYQRRMWVQKFAGVVPSKAALLRAAQMEMAAEGLPLAMLLFGRMNDGGLVVVLQTHTFAPLDTVLEDLKKRTRLFR